MTLQYADRVQETTVTVGTITYVLAGAVSGYRAFSAVCANNDTAYYAITNGVDWEVGLGTWTTGNNLARTTIIASSNANAAVNWASGSKTIFLTAPASHLQPLGTGDSPTFSGLNASGSVKILKSNNNPVIDKINIQTFISSGTYTPTSGMVYCIIEAVGGGGGGGGSPAAATSSTGGGGGGGGGYSRVTVTSATVGASQTVTIGALGSGGAAGGNSGNNGGQTSVGSLCVANGGNGGTRADFIGGGGGGGGAGTGDVTATGIPGASGTYATTSTVGGISGNGGSSAFGGGGAGAVALNAATAGNPGAGYGSGGSGAVVNGSASTAKGGDGTKGFVIITEFLSA